MAFYTDDKQLYGYLRDLFARVQNDSSGGMEALADSRLIIRIRCQDPSAQVTVNSRRRPPQVVYGASALRPDLEATLSADTLHRILLNELSMKEAMARGLMQVRGPVQKTLALADLIRAGRQFYPQVLRDRSS